MKGLSFSEPMVNAWLAGNKTVTRRLISNRLLEKYYAYDEWCNSVMPTDIPCSREYETQFFASRAPYLPGETVYIKETWRVGAWGENDNMIAVDYKADGYCRKEWIFLGFTDEAESQFYKLWQQSTDDAEKVYGRQEQYKWKPGQSPCRWRSPITMPAWASRSKARIVSVRPERVQEITADDIRNEGTPNTPHDSNCLIAERQSFIDLWESLHPGSWERNDWVWRIELRKEANHA